MSKVKIELNKAGVRGMLQSAEMMSVCREHAEAIAGRAGEGYEVSTYTGKTRVNASVITATPDAMRDNMENNTLLKAVRG